MLISQGLYQNLLPFSCPHKTSCVSGLLTPTNNFPKILRSRLELGLVFYGEKSTSVFGLGFCLVGFFFLHQIPKSPL